MLLVYGVKRRGSGDLISRAVGASGLWIIAAGRAEELDERGALADLAFKEIFLPLARPEAPLPSPIRRHGQGPFPSPALPPLRLLRAGWRGFISMLRGIKTVPF